MLNVYVTPLIINDKFVSLFSLFKANYILRMANMYYLFKIQARELDFVLNNVIETSFTYTVMQF